MARALLLAGACALSLPVAAIQGVDAPAAGSNTATSILTSPITLLNDRDVVFGVVTQPGSLLTAGDVLALRTNSQTAGDRTLR